MFQEYTLWDRDSDQSASGLRNRLRVENLAQFVLIRPEICRLRNYPFSLRRRHARRAGSGYSRLRLL